MLSVSLTLSVQIRQSASTVQRQLLAACNAFSCQHLTSKIKWTADFFDAYCICYALVKPSIRSDCTGQLAGVVTQAICVPSSNSLASLITLLLVLQMAILDGKEYASLLDGRDNTEEEVTKCILLTNNQVGRFSQPAPALPMLRYYRLICVFPSGAPGYWPSFQSRSNSVGYSCPQRRAECLMVGSACPEITDGIPH